MTDVQSTLLQLLAMELFDAPCTVGPVDWAAVRKEAQVQAVECLMLHAKRELDAAERPDIAEQLAFAKLVDDANRRMHNHVLLHEWLDGAGVPYVVLKGVASGAYYPNPILRKYGDVDFYVEPQHLEAAGKVFEAHGLHKTGDKHYAHVVYTKPGMWLEMHYAPPGGWPEGAAGEVVRDCMRSIVDERVLSTEFGGPMYLPSTFHHGLTVLLHSRSHLLKRGIGARHFADWAVFASSLDDETFRGSFEKPLKAAGLWRFAQLFGRAAATFMGAPSRRWMGAVEADHDVQSELAEDILQAGNFGDRDMEARRYHGHLLASGKGTGNTAAYAARSVFASLNRMTRTNWPAARKVKLLYPIGWAFFGTRQIWRIATGKKRALDPNKAMQGLQRRRDLYDELGLFDLKEE